MVVVRWNPLVKKGEGNLKRIGEIHQQNICESQFPVHKSNQVELYLQIADFFLRILIIHSVLPFYDFNIM